jgi:hypothetical protein
MHIPQLEKYDAAVQHMGGYLSGYPWNVIGTGTYRDPVGAPRAEALMKRYIDRLGRKIKAPVSYAAALEHRWSGNGLPGTPYHWHFLVASPHSYRLAEVAEDLWREKFGIAQVRNYDPSRNGTYYVAKTVSDPDGHPLLMGGLDLLPYTGPADLIGAAQQNAYVPSHLAERSHGQYLRIR